MSKSTMTAENNTGAMTQSTGLMFQNLSIYKEVFWW
jgi:hypothetical protein